MGSCSENGCEFQTNPSCNRPESKIVSDEDEDIEGTLEMKLQRKEEGSWITKETISENIVVPAKGIVRLDLGRNNLGDDLFEGWNEKNIVAAVNEEGYYRVYASFAMEGKETIEDSWKIKVEGNSELGTISLFGRFIEWLKSLVVKKDEINFKNYGELAQTGGGGDVDVEISIATIKDDYNTEEQILLTPTEMPEEECQYPDPDIDISVTNLQNPNYLESIIDPSFCGEIKRITDKNPNRIINKDEDDIGKWGTIVKNGYVTNTPWNINDELLFLISKNPSFRMTVYANSFLPKKKELVKNSNVRWSKNLLIPYMQFAFPNNAEYYYKWDVNVGYNRDTMEGIEKIDLPFKVLKTPKLDTAYFNGKEYIAVPGIQDDTGDVYIYLIELSNVDSPVVTSYKLENPDDIILHSFRFSPDAKHVIYAYNDDLWRILDIDLDSKLIYPHELPSNPSNCGSSCKNTDLSNGYFSFEWGHPILGYGSDQDIYIVGQNARWNKKILEGVEGIKEDNKLGRVGAYNVNDKKYKSLTHPDRINSEEEFEEVGESEPFHFSIEKGYGFIAYAKFTSGAGRGPKYQNELLAIDIVNPSNGIYRLGYHRANQANGIDYQVFPSASHDLKNLIFSSSWGDDQSQVNSYIIDLDLPKSEPAEENQRGKIWNKQQVVVGGRIDAIDYLGNGVILIGTRSPLPGRIYKSTDYGESWTNKGIVTGSSFNDGITDIVSAGEGIAYVLTQDSYFWKTTNYGENWKNLGRISTNSRRSPFSLSYALEVTKEGTILLTDTTSSGGHIFRSTDKGESWTNIGVVSTDSLYRLEEIGDGIIVNGWNGHIYKSIDDGLTWSDKGRLTSSYLYATEYLGNGIVLQGSDSGHIFRSTDNGESWEDLGKVGDFADDFVNLGNGVVIYTTYKGSKEMYRSADYGLTWTSIGTVQTGASGDWFDHAIYVNDGVKEFGVGGTNKGYILKFLPS